MKKLSVLSLALILAILMILSTASIAEPAVVEPISEAFEYDYEEFPLERNGIELHLDRVKVEGTEPEHNILLVHGLTYSSHEFDINYEDYSLVRLLARDGYAVWRVDVAGYGRSGQVEDGFQPDSDYAGEDINAAVGKICEVSGQDRIGCCAQARGTMTGRAAPTEVGATSAWMNRSP